MISFSRKFTRPISMKIMTLIYQLLGWDVTQVYVLNPFGESYLRLDCSKEAER